jgi:RimJ/RimL family protein N-acetyltransferase
MLLVSILDDSREFVGYGGLTHIDWLHRRAEISFLVDPERAADRERYEADFSAFLDFLERWAFTDLGLNRLYTETYAFREHHIRILESRGLEPEGHLRQHILDPVGDGGFVDSIIHGITADRWNGEPR